MHGVVGEERATCSASQVELALGDHWVRGDTIGMECLFD